MTATDFIITLAMLNVCFVSFIWIIKQIIQLCYWYYKREEKENE